MPERPILRPNYHKSAPTAETETRRLLVALAKAKARKEEKVDG